MIVPNPEPAVDERALLDSSLDAKLTLSEEPTPHCAGLWTALERRIAGREDDDEWNVEGKVTTRWGEEDDDGAAGEIAETLLSLPDESMRILRGRAASDGMEGEETAASDCEAEEWRCLRVGRVVGERVSDSEDSARALE